MFDLDIMVEKNYDPTTTLLKYCSSSHTTLIYKIAVKIYSTFVLNVIRQLFFNKELLIIVKSFFLKHDQYNFVILFFLTPRNSNALRKYI